MDVRSLELIDAYLNAQVGWLDAVGALSRKLVFYEILSAYAQPAMKSFPHMLSNR
jgi:hypothetical protein